MMRVVLAVCGMEAVLSQKFPPRCILSVVPDLLPDRL